MSLLEQADLAAKKIEQLRRKAEQTPIFTVKPILEAMGREQALFNRLTVEILRNGKS